MDLLWIFFWFQVKHFLCDYPLQAFPYMYRNKGNIGHPGGYLHAGIHGIGTFLVCSFLSGTYYNLLLISMADAVIHFNIDYCKKNLVDYLTLSPIKHESFWIVLGFDQLLHQLTYIIIIGNFFT